MRSPVDRVMRGREAQGTMVLAAQATATLEAPDTAAQVAKRMTGPVARHIPARVARAAQGLEGHVIRVPGVRAVRVRRYANESIVGINGDAPL